MENVIDCVLKGMQSQLDVEIKPLQFPLIVILPNED